MIALYKDPQGKNVFKRMEVKTTTTEMKSGSSGSASTNTASTVDKEGVSELTILRERVTQLEAKLKLHEERKGSEN